MALIEETNSVSYKAVVLSELPNGKYVNLITLRAYSGGIDLNIDYSCTYELPCDIYINVNTDGILGNNTFPIWEGSQNGTRTSVDIGGSTIEIKGIGFTMEDAESGQQECEDDTYIYRIKNN